jgi:hypothetical protein
MSAVTRGLTHSRVMPPRLTTSHLRQPQRSPFTKCIFCQEQYIGARHFSASAARKNGNPRRGGDSFTSRLRSAWGRTQIQWKPIPVGLGIGFLGFVQFYRIQQREKLKDKEGDGEDGNGKPKKRQRIRPSGPWYEPTAPFEI